MSLCLIIFSSCQQEDIQPSLNSLNDIESTNSGSSTSESSEGSMSHDVTLSDFLSDLYYHRSDVTKIVLTVTNYPSIYWYENVRDVEYQLYNGSPFDAKKIDIAIRNAINNNIIEVNKDKLIQVEGSGPDGYIGKINLYAQLTDEKRAWFKIEEAGPIRILQ